ncbi:RXT2-like protein [Dendryphion nanum]|uniref:RXT2-like protein n=1 Tax=Dendryphion nanum TaxID=256645 RepID=A0A9P9D8H4_9PLEO|nr:RXT2-like protein [Dendryphion nanum]
MAGQQQQIIETIFNMKRRLLRKEDSSDSDESDTPYNNGMRSLKRRVQYTRHGKPESPSDPPPYKKRIEHAGYQRYILHRNPPRYDPDGDIVERNDEYDDEDDLSTVEEDPYADIKLEEILMPLSSAADLPTHPALNIAYTSKHLTNMTTEAGAISRKEQMALWRAKTLFTKFMGDMSYVPTGLADLDEGDILRELSTNGVNGVTQAATNGVPSRAFIQARENGHRQPGTDIHDVEMGGVDQTNGDRLLPTETNGYATIEVAAVQNGNTQHATNGDLGYTTERRVYENGDQPRSPPLEDTDDDESEQTSHRMTTRARAQVASDPSPPDSPSNAANPIHPLYSFQTESVPDRDFGLPAAEAEETRLLLLAFVQKQEELSRTATDLYMGMLQGERMRQEVFKAAKAEAHVGEMSDGEDWYDREEWNLDQDLMKGRDEEEDETAVAGKKSTRQRRKPDKEDR